MSGLYTNGVPLAVLPFTGNERLPLDTQATGGGIPETEAASLGQLSNYFSSVPAWVSGRFYGLPLGATTAAVLTVTGVLYAYPIYIPSAVTLKSLNLSVTTGQTGGAAHVALYADNGAGYPGAIVAGTDTGALAATATAVVGPTTLALTLNPGTYWVASEFTASGTFPSVEGITATYTGVVSNSLGYSSAANALTATGTAVTGIQVANTYGSLPLTFPTGATLTANATTPAVAIGV